MFFQSSRLRSGLRQRRSGARRAATLAELVVASTLFLTATGFLLTAAVGLQRLWLDGVRYRLAVDELSNQLETLTMRPATEIEGAVSNLKLSEALALQLPSAVLEGQVSRENGIMQIELRLDWQRPGEAEPVVLTGWKEQVEEKDDDAL